MRTSDNPELQLIAEAIAAFNENNNARVKRDLLPLDSFVFLGITMIDTFPTFYKIPITETLATCIMAGSYPGTPTVVESFFPPVPRPLLAEAEGMLPLDNRRTIFQCFEALKGLLMGACLFQPYIKTYRAM